jgi:hypothetical protein
MLSPTFFSLSIFLRLGVGILILSILWLAVLWAIALP